MTLSEFRDQMVSCRVAADREANRNRDPQVALEQLRELYSSVDLAERDLADQVISEWVLADDESVRFDALHLVYQFRITRAVPSLDALAQRLKASTTPGAPFELEKVERLILEIGG